MPASSSSTSSTVRSSTLATHPDLPVPVQLQPMSRARRMRLRFDERALVLKLTHPRRVSASKALAWAATHKQWVAEQIGRLPPAEPFVPGALIPLEGQEVELRWSGAGRRSPTLSDGVLLCGGPPEAFARRVESFLRKRALQTLSRETAEFAAKAGLRAVAVGVGDARTRWGSCSSAGRIRYSWRLILAPVEARRYVVAHEVAHLRHLDHGREFKALERELFGGDTRRAQGLLREAAPRIRRIGILA